MSKNSVQILKESYKKEFLSEWSISDADMKKRYGDRWADAKARIIDARIDERIAEHGGEDKVIMEGNLIRLDKVFTEQYLYRKSPDGHQMIFIKGTGLPYKIELVGESIKVMRGIDVLETYPNIDRFNEALYANSVSELDNLKQFIV